MVGVMPVYVSPPELLAVAEINEAVDRGDSQKLLAALLLPSCGIDEVFAANGCRYLTLLTRLKQRKAQVRPRRALAGCLLGLGLGYLCTCPVQADGRCCSGVREGFFPQIYLSCISLHNLLFLIFSLVFSFCKSTSHPK